MSRHSLSRNFRWLQGWLLVLPAAVLLVGFTHWPVIATLIDSLFSTPRRGRAPDFVGMANYERLMADPVFWKVVTNNLLFALGTIPCSIALAIVMAVWVNGRVRGRAGLRLAYFTPTVLPMIAAANIWLFFYTPDYGLLDQIGGLFGADRTNWLGDQRTVLWCIVAMTVWKEAGFFMIFYLAGLQQISPDLGEAAAIEGAGRWYFFRRVTLPLLMPTTLFVLVNAVINSFKLVDHVVVMTKGGPDNASSLILYYIYETAFNFWDTSYAAALTAVLLAILSVLAVLQFAVLERRVHYR
ncbi:MAG: sugar ABC transporter permease [Alphaproteobacteria bacterium]|nr:sugar ABC transporter permease [Alphaproteobacteria bacterium]